MKIDVKFNLDRETKGAVRYQEVDAKGKPKAGDAEKAVIGTLYLRKAQLPDGSFPQQITVSITA